MAKLLSNQKTQELAQTLLEATGEQALRLGRQSSIKSVVYEAIIKEPKQKHKQKNRKPRNRRAFKSHLADGRAVLGKTSSRSTVDTLYPCVMYNIDEFSSKGYQLPIRSWGYNAEQETLKVLFVQPKYTYLYLYYGVTPQEIANAETYDRFMDFYNSEIKGGNKKSVRLA